MKYFLSAGLYVAETRPMRSRHSRSGFIFAKSRVHCALPSAPYPAKNSYFEASFMLAMDGVTRMRYVWSELIQLL